MDENQSNENNNEIIGQSFRAANTEENFNSFNNNSKKKKSGGAGFGKTVVLPFVCGVLGATIVIRYLCYSA